MSDYSGEVGEKRHCKVPLAKTVVPPNHPFKNKGNHQLLLSYLQARLLAGKRARDAELSRFVRVDKTVSGWMKMSTEDKIREQKAADDGSPQATQINLPLSFIHLDDMMTYFAATFAPNRGMFYQAGKVDQTQPAAQVVTKMNNDAIYGGYFREVLGGIYSLLKYNRGGFHVFWSREDGPKLSKDSQTGQDRVDMQLRWQGNKLEAIDMYNFLADPGVHPTKLHIDGEFAATARMRSFYWLQNKASQGVYYNCEEALDLDCGESRTTVYYRSPPKEAQFDSNDGTGSGTDWVSILSEASSFTHETAFELVEIFIRLNPTEFGLIAGKKDEVSARNRYEIWRFTILNDKWIVDATYMSNIHGFLPFFIGLLHDDLMSTSQKSVAEILQPLQSFASFLMNIHLAVSRQNVFGLTIFDPSMVDLAAIPPGEVSATVPCLPPAYGKDLRMSVVKPGTTLDSKQTLQDLQGMMQMIDQFFPTQSLPSQIANIDRAIDSQVAAVQQGANRRQQKAARLLDDSVFRNVRFALYYNLLQFQPEDEEVTDYYTGKPVKLNLDAIRNTDLPFIIGQGLKAIDRQATAKNIQQIVFALIQAPQAAQGIDLLKFINFWSDMIDVDMDFEQFRLAPPPAAGQPGAEAPPTDAAGNPIQPATAPGALTSPIYAGHAQP